MFPNRIRSESVCCRLDTLIEEWNLDQKKEQRIEVPVRVNSFALLVKKII